MKFQFSIRKRLFFFTLLIITAGKASGQNPYYIPAEANFDKDLPSPEVFLGYEIGSHHTRYDRMVDYFELLDKMSTQTELHTIGVTNELRPQISLIISSRENIARIDDIRARHMQFSHPGSGNPDPEGTPLVIHLGFNVHGNEASGGEAALLTAYYLLASKSPEVRAWLENALIMIEPALNPDGRDRFAQWVNMHKGYPPVSDPNDREHNEVWPGGRTNHYWFDLNRDWLPASQVESQNRLEWYHHWMPNVVTDHHEMGTNSTFFFEPTAPGAENPLVPERNYKELNVLYANEFARALDSINSYYDSGMSFDNLYPGYGSSYGDLQGGLALLFEQASSRGLKQMTNMGLILPFKKGIRNQFVSALATVRASVDNKSLLNNYQLEFFTGSMEMGRKRDFSGFVFGDPRDKGRSRKFCALLKMHQVDFYPLSEDLEAEGQSFAAGNSWVVPLQQPQYRMVKTLFETDKSFVDSVFYDATAWAMVYSYGLPFARIKGALPERLEADPRPTAKASVPPYSDYGYVFSWDDYYAPRLLYLLQSRGALAKAAWEPFAVQTHLGSREFGRGSIILPAPYQHLRADSLHRLVQQACACCNTQIYALKSGQPLTGPYPGNSRFRPLEKPRVVMPIGGSVRSTEAGALWHLFDEQLHMPVTKPETEDLDRINLADYNTLLLPSGGYYEWGEQEAGKISEWVRAGGTLIAIKNGLNWLQQQEMIRLERVNASESNSETPRYDYNKASGHRRKHSIGGIFVEADLDITHPLAFGYYDRKITLYRNHTSFYQPVKNSTGNVMLYREDPLTGGFITPENLSKLEGSAALISQRSGRGRIIMFVDDPAFRGCWYGTNRLLFNAIFLGNGM